MSDTLCCTERDIKETFDAFEIQEDGTTDMLTARYCTTCSTIVNRIRYKNVQLIDEQVNHDLPPGITVERGERRVGRNPEVTKLVLKGE